MGSLADGVKNGGVRGSSDLAQGFVEGNACGGGQVKAPGIFPHGDGETGGSVLGKEGFREAAGFPAEDKIVAVHERLVPVGTGRLC